MTAVEFCQLLAQIPGRLSGIDVAVVVPQGANPHWQTEFRRLQKRMPKQKAKVAVARKLLVAVWHLLAHEEADRRSTDQQLAAAFFALAYKVGVKNLPKGQSARQFTRNQLDRLGIGQEMTHSEAPPLINMLLLTFLSQVSTFEWY